MQTASGPYGAPLAAPYATQGYAAPMAANQEYLYGLQAAKDVRNALMIKRLFLALVILLVILTIGFTGHHHTKRMRHHKNHFDNKVGVRKHNNLTTGGMNSHWWHGSGDAGHGGSVHRDETAIHKAIYAPHAYREGLVVDPPVVCKPGETAKVVKLSDNYVFVGYDTNNPDPTKKGTPIYKTVPGGTTTVCESSATSKRYSLDPRSGMGDDDDSGLGGDPDGSSYKGHGGCPPWDPEATADAVALGQVGGFQHDNAYGERRLQNAFNITDDQLNAIMHQ